MDNFLNDFQARIRGPGGAVAIVKDGAILASRTWGFAELDRRIPMKTSTHLPICSISKQMVCLVLADLHRHPTTSMVERGVGIEEQLSTELQRILPHLTNHEQGELKLPHLHNMQSGIRDWWASTTLWGARPDDSFSLTTDAPKSLERLRSFHFTPGTEYSYSNPNFHVLARVLENVSGQSLGQLLAERVFKPAGMVTAALCANTAGHPLPCVGYEGDEKTGYVPAVNRIEWSGDAGIVATLDDMIAYEMYLDRSWHEPGSNYSVIAKPQTYNDGSPAVYGYGLIHGNAKGNLSLGHGGALRGYRLHRIHVPAARVSVVVMLNHESDAAGAAELVLQHVLNTEDVVPNAHLEPTATWLGDYLDADTQLLIHVARADAGKLGISYAVSTETVTLTTPSTAESRLMQARIEDEVLHVKRLKDNRVLRARRVERSACPATDDYAGEYHCPDTDSTLRCIGGNGLMYGCFDGHLGSGPPHLMRYVGDDIWLLACPRGLDAPAPGDWTVIFERGGDGSIVGVTVGCWLARRVHYGNKT
jgi:CubicO group peptidase (beta-lactamase class C family)